MFNGGFALMCKYNAVKKSKTPRAFVPNHKLYLLLLAAFIVLTIVSLWVKDNNAVFTICISITCGAIASILVAWLIDEANCRQANTKVFEYRRIILGDLHSSFDVGAAQMEWEQ